MATGLYDPAYEHDACGVGMVADLHGRPDHDIVDRGLTVLERLAHRGASGPRWTPATAPASWSRSRTASCRRGQAAGFTLPDAGGYAVGLAFLPTDADDAAKARTVVEQTGGRGGARPSSAGARCPTETDGLGAIAERRHAADRAALRRPAPGPGRRHHGAGAAAPSCCASGPSTRSTTCYFPSLSARTIVYKGMLTSAAAAPSSSPTSRRALRVGPGPGALALLHQHLPELAAGPPLPLPRPQRRDQHAGRQPQLDAGPRGAARDRPDRGRPVARLPDLHAGGERLGQLRRGARAAAPRRPLAARTPC